MTGPLRWSIVIASLDPAVGHEQPGRRRVLVVSYEAFHRSGLATICPISARPPRYPGEVALPRGHAGQTEDAVILCHQLRTVDLERVTSFEIGGEPQRLSDPLIRGQVRAALAHQLGLDIRTPLDDAA
ncbi:MAG: type II toxin-antitoxin system PemK/MazF family toxin [Chloroflexi bacterium]|nr:MAG: type II toxin-antitoxin system PemK/MazF family toxin [Chloroflexota bacterium]